MGPSLAARLLLFVGGAQVYHGRAAPGSPSRRLFDTF
jgi:hypothetical protein